MGGGSVVAEVRAGADPAASSVLLLGGRPVPVVGAGLRIDEATPLAFGLGPGVTGRLNLAGMPVPLVDGRADAAWVDESRREQWVGELDLELVMTAPQPMVLRPKVVVLPRRATMEGFAFLVDQFRSWAGPGALADPAGRARIWAELAPRVPKQEEERALVALALLRRAIPALAALHRAPATTPTERREWCALDRTAGRRILMRRLHPFDPPRPAQQPRFGQVATIVVMISDTGRRRISAPSSCSLRTTSRSDTMPTTPSCDITTIAPMLCTVSSVSSPETDVSGVMVATDAPLFRNTSEIRIVPPLVMYFTPG